MAGALVVVYSTAGVTAYAHGVGCFAKGSSAAELPADDGTRGGGGDVDLEAEAQRRRNREALTKPVQGLLSAVAASTKSSTEGALQLCTMATADGSVVGFARPRKPAKKNATAAGSKARGGDDADEEEAEEEVLVAVLLKQADAGSPPSVPRAQVVIRSQELIALAAVIGNAAVAFLGWPVVEDANKIRAPAAHRAFSHGLRPVLDAVLAPYATFEEGDYHGMKGASKHESGTKSPGGSKAQKRSHLHSRVSVPMGLAAGACVERFVTGPEELLELSTMCDELLECAGERNCLGVALLLVDERRARDHQASAAAGTGRVRLLAATASWFDRLSSGEAFTMVTSASSATQMEEGCTEVYLPQFSAGGVLTPGRTPFRCITVPLDLPGTSATRGLNAHQRLTVSFVCNKVEPSVEDIVGVVSGALPVDKLTWLGTLTRNSGSFCTVASPSISDKLAGHVDGQVLAMLLRTQQHGRCMRSGELVVAGDSQGAQVVLWERERKERDDRGLVRDNSSGSCMVSALLSAPLSVDEVERIGVPANSTVVTVVAELAKNPKGSASAPLLEGVVLLGEAVPPYAREGVAKKAVNSFANCSQHVWN